MSPSVEPHHPLQPEYEKFLSPALARELVRQYVRLKRRAWGGDHEGVLEVGGKIAEHALRATQHLAGVHSIALRTEIRNMKGECDKLEQIPAAQASDALRIVVPRTILTLYTIRNKRSGGHTASEVDPSRADALLTERLADWLMAELFRLGHQMPLDQAEGVLEALVDRRLPVVFRSGEYRRVLKQGLAPKEEILVLLYGEANGATRQELQAWSRIPPTSLDRYLDQLDSDRLVRIATEGRTKRVFILPSGERQVESAGLLAPE